MVMLHATEHDGVRGKGDRRGDGRGKETNGQVVEDISLGVECLCY